MKIKDSNRRSFVKRLALSTGLLGTLSSFDLWSNIDKKDLKIQSDLHLKMTGYKYPRIQTLFEALSASKTTNYNYMTKLGWAFDTLPWYGQQHEEVKKLMGENFWTYGIEENKKTLESICRYCYDQGLSKQKVSIEDLFHPSSLEFTEAS